MHNFIHFSFFHSSFKMTSIFGLLWLFFCLIKFVVGENLNCSFSFNLDEYQCEMLNSFTLLSPTVTLIYGNHELDKNDESVKSFFVSNEQSTIFLPLNICLSFKNIEKFESNGKLIREISRNVFSGCKRVKCIKVLEAAISWLPEDTFFDLINLSSLEIVGSKVEYLPLDLFSRNQEIKVLNFQRNSLKVIDVVIPKSVNSALFLGNICVDENFTDQENLTRAIDEKCKSSTKTELMKAERNRELIQAELDAKILQVTHSFNVRQALTLKLEKSNKLIENTRKRNVQLNSDIKEINLTLSQTLNELEILNKTFMELQSTFANFKENCSADENKSMEMKIVNLNIKLVKMTKEVKECKEIVVLMNETANEVSTEFSSSVSETNNESANETTEISTEILSSAVVSQLEVCESEKTNLTEQLNAMESKLLNIEFCNATTTGKEEELITTFNHFLGTEDLKADTVIYSLVGVAGVSGGLNFILLVKILKR